MVNQSHTPLGTTRSLQLLLILRYIPVTPLIRKCTTRRWTLRCSHYSVAKRQQFSCPLSLRNQIIANKTTTRTNPSQSTSTHPTQINILSPSFAKLVSLLYFYCQYEIMMFSDNHYFAFSRAPVSRLHTCWRDRGIPSSYRNTR